MNIFITGGSSGLGRSITENLAAAHPSAKIYSTYNSSSEAATEIQSRFNNVTPVHLDFSSEESVNKVAAQMAELDIDVLINNAVAFMEKNHFHKIEPEIFNRSFMVNVVPVLSLTSAFIKSARQKKSGRIITILSTAISGTPLMGWSEYTANKNYLFSMAKSWAIENVQFNIQSNCISPEFMDTPLNSTLDIRLKEEMIRTHPLKKLLTTNEVADMVACLISASPHLNGQNVSLSTARS